MSNSSQGPGWWMASDGKWYAPEQHPDYRPSGSAPPPDSAPTTAAPPPMPQAAMPTAQITCPGCNTKVHLPTDSTRGVCPNCSNAIVFRKCVSTGTTLPVLESWTTWTHSGCPIKHSVANVSNPRFNCPRCNKVTRLEQKGGRRYRCADCRKLYVKCSCDTFVKPPLIAGTRWKCPNCGTWHSGNY
jgi:predicted RNA-binding Zn-ribbon protein involved in translation (DUF1610 family)